MKETRIKDVSIDIQTGPFGSQLHASDYSVDGVPVIMPQDILNFRISEKQIARVDESHVLRLKHHKVNKGDIIFPRRGNFSKCALITNYERGWLCGTGCLKIKLNTYKVFPEYVYFALQQPKVIRLIEDNTVGSTMPNLNTKILGNISIPYVPESISEQKSIAEVLHDVDALIATTEALLQKKRDIKQGTMQQLLSGKRRLPGFSEPWVRMNIQTDATVSARIGWQGLTTEEYRDSGDYYVIGGTDFEKGHINWADAKFVSYDRYLQDKKIQIIINDVLVTKDGTIGKVAFIDTLPKNGTLNSGVFVVRSKNDKLYQPFLALIFLSSIFSDFIERISAGSTIKHLFQRDIVKFSFFVPNDINEQFTIYKIISDMDIEIEALEENLTKYKAIREAMMQQLLTGKIRLI